MEVDPPADSAATGDDWDPWAWNAALSRDFRDAMQLLVADRQGHPGMRSFDYVVRSCFAEVLQHNNIEQITISLFRWNLFKGAHETIIRSLTDTYWSLSYNSLDRDGQ
jgi:hypothetical protein